MYRLLVTTGILAVLILSTIVAPVATALAGGDFQAGRIMDDGVFFNGQAIAPSDIQAFLNSKVPNCDTNGTAAYGGTTRAAYGASQGYAAPYTCLKDFRQDTQGTSAEAGLCSAIPGGSRSSAEIIYEVGNACGINQGVLLVLLQKEQSLVTDEWPWSIQYRSATGYACPDTAPCDTSYYGFFNQVYNAARQFKRYQRDESSFRYRAFRSNTIQYSPNVSCGASDVFVQNQATAGLYNYTPYQPDGPALANLYGAGGNCSAYGNRNFWRQYIEWFGNIYSDEYIWKVIRTSSDGRLFLQVGNTKRWIPTGEIYNDWALSQFPTTIVSDAAFDAIPTIPELTRLGSNGQYNYVVDNGQKHYLPAKYLALWNYQDAIAAPVSSLLRRLPEIEPMGRFIQDPSNNYWLIDGAVRHSIAQADLSAWGVSQPDITTIKANYLSAIAAGPAAGRNVQYSGSSYVVDQGGLLKMPDSNIASAWQQGSFVSIGSSAGSLEPQRGTANYLVKASNSQDWYMLGDRKKYYIMSADIATSWGMPTNTLVSLAPEYLAQFPSGDALTNFVKDSTSQMVYVLDGQKHHIVNSNLLATLTPNTTFSSLSSTRLNAIQTGVAYTQPLVQVSGTPHLWLLDNGMRYHVNTNAVYSAYDSNEAGLTLSGTLVNNMPLGPTELGGVFRSATGTYYLADHGKKTVIAPAAISAWQSVNNPTFTDGLINLLPDSGQPAITTRYTRFNGGTYFVDKGIMTRVNSSNVSSYPGASSGYQLTNGSLALTSLQASYLLQSSEDRKYWFINQGTKAEVNFPQAVTLGYLSTGLQPAQVSNTFLDTFPNSNNISLLIRKQGSDGVKLINFGQALGFQNSDTLLNTMGPTNQIITIDNSIYDAFAVIGSTSKIVKDDAGKIYLLQSGQRRWLASSGAYQPYANIPVTYLYGTTMALIPLGAPIN